MARRLRPAEERFWPKVDVHGPDECWPWRGSRDPAGYGMLSAGRRGQVVHLRASRLSWEIAHGMPVPERRSVLHHCDNPPCVNPAHLYVGSTADNARDRGERRRGREHRQQGEANLNAKLTEAQVREIIAALQVLPRRSQADIAREFDVRQPQVSRIMRGTTWRHLWDE